ncbi:uncharacterized protein [Littorina saxatilis]|uniref:Uncharacterized protein n=1 Tax=Littorina saxatilis TaxID=31220 RepID=A0AAN9AS14_9CAEN
MSYAKSLLDRTNTGAHLTSSQAECERATDDLRPLGQGRMCQVIWDGWLCWPQTLAGAVIKQPCPDIYQYNIHQFAYRRCMLNGTWYGSGADSLSPENQGWSDYSLCVLPSLTTGSAFPFGGSDVTDAGYDATSGNDDSSGSLGSLETFPVAQSFSTANTNVTLPTDDVIGSVLHGVSAVCLLLALVTWVTLRLTDRLVTRRYLVLIATIVVSFLFHTIVLTSRLRALALVLGETSGTHTHRPSPSFSPNVETTYRPPGLEFTTPFTVQSATTFLNAGDQFRFYDPYAETFKMAASTNGRHSGNSDETGFLSDGPGPARSKYVNKFRRAAKKRRNEKEQDSSEKKNSGKKRKRNRKGRKSKKGGNKDKKRIVAETAKTPANDDDDSWVTLCQVGRAFYLLTDLCVFSFLLSVSLYYTLVVLGNELTFNRLVTMFLLGLGLPVLFVTFTILLYTFLATETGFGSSCTVDELGDEFHWAVTGPKFICIVLSLCLMTVSTYGFWRLHVPALNASSETFYARQGVLKTLALLLCFSQAELFWLVTEYQKIYGWVTSPYVIYASTAVYGTKGCVMAFLFCFVDKEVLHGTCCAPSYSDGEPWLRAAGPDTSPRGGGGGGRERGGGGGGGGGGGMEGAGGRRWRERTDDGSGVNDFEMDDVPQWGHHYGKPYHDVIGSMDFGEKV